MKIRKYYCTYSKKYLPPAGLTQTAVAFMEKRRKPQPDTPFANQL